MPIDITTSNDGVRIEKKLNPIIIKKRKRMECAVI